MASAVSHSTSIQGGGPFRGVTGSSAGILSAMASANSQAVSQTGLLDTFSDSQDCAAKRSSRPDFFSALFGRDDVSSDSTEIIVWDTESPSLIKHTCSMFPALRSRKNFLPV